ncbi:hypothetical protein HYR54_15680 [Candidatus Acetothermia bacterium]|nr:hypothetical protein [Candidatus Acetothermia bacterium]
MTNVLYGAFSPTMSPDGKKIALISYDIPGYDVYTIDADPATWKSVPYHHEKLPQPPNYAELTKDYKVRPYSPVDTLLPHSWQPIATVNQVGAALTGQDLLWHTNYLAGAWVNFNGDGDGELLLTHSFADLAGPIEPAVPLVSLLLSPRFIQGVFSWPFQQSMRFQQKIDLSAKWGAQPPLQTPDGPVPQSGWLASGNWTMSLSGGRDSVRNFYSFSLQSTALLTNATQGIDVGAEASATWVFDGATAFGCNLKVNAGPRALAVCLIHMPVLWLEWQFGTWPIYFERMDILGVVAVQYADGELKPVYSGAVLFPIYLWYKIRIEFVLGLAVGPTGLVVPIITFQFGQP